MDRETVEEALLSMQTDIAEKIRVSEADLGEAVKKGPADRTFRVDTVSEEVMEETLEELSSQFSFKLVNEEKGTEVYGEDPNFTLITDTVDGSRLLGAGLSGAYSMAAVTPVTKSPTLEDVEIAVQTELPVPRHRTGDQFLWREGEGLRSRRFPDSEGFSRVKTGSRSPRETELMSYVPPFHGPSPVADQVQAAVEPLMEPELTPDLRNSSGGQLANVSLGRYGFVVDVRPLEGEIREKSVERTAKPYDVCTYRAFASEEARFYSILPYEGSYQLQEGIPVPLDIETPVGWIGYASEGLEEKLHSAVTEVLSENGVVV